MSAQPFVRDGLSAHRRNSSNLKSMCRMCATPCEKSVLIFGPEGVENELALKIQNHLPIKVSESDTLPLQLCYNCTNTLIEWDAAVLGSTAAEKKLRAIQWQEQLLNLNPVQQIQDPTETSEESKRQRVPNAEESLCCSVCNRGGMHFRELINHLKSHDSDGDRQQEQSAGENDTKTSSHKSDSESPTRTPRRAKKRRSKTTRSSEEDINFQPVVCLEPLKMELRPRRKVTNMTSGTSDTNLSADKRDFSKEKQKGNSSKLLFDSVVSIPFPAEGGSGDPLVTSSTSTPPFPNENAIGSVRVEKPLNFNSNENSQEKNDPKQQATSEGQNTTFRPKVRIISAEHINHNLEQRAKANQNSKNLQSFIPNEAHQKTGSVLRSKLSEQPDSSFPRSKSSKIVLSSSVIKEFSLNHLGTGPKYLRLPDGRIVRLLPGPQSQTQGNSKVKGSVSLSRPSSNPSTASGSPQVKLPGLSVCEKNGANDGSSQITKLTNLKVSDPQRDSCDLQIQISGVNTVSDSMDSVVPIQKMNTVGIGQQKLLPATTSKQPSLPTATVPCAEERVTKDRTLVTFKLQPGPKFRTARYSCVVCGERNLLHETLQVHAQLHCPPKIQKEVKLPTPSSA